MKSIVMKTPLKSRHFLLIRLCILLPVGFLLVNNLHAAGPTASEQRREAKAKVKAFWEKFEPLKKEQSGLLRQAKKIAEGRAGFAASYGFVPRDRPTSAQLCATCPKMRSQAGWAKALVSGLEEWNKYCEKELAKLAASGSGDSSNITSLIQELKKALNSF